MLPINTVEKPGFKGMISRFNPRYQLPSRIRVAIPSLYTSTREIVQKSVKEEKDFFASTIDLWSSVAMEPYLSFSIHSSLFIMGAADPDLLPPISAHASKSYWCKHQGMS